MSRVQRCESPSATCAARSRYREGATCTPSAGGGAPARTSAAHGPRPRPPPPPPRPAPGPAPAPPPGPGARRCAGVGSPLAFLAVYFISPHLVSPFLTGESRDINHKVPHTCTLRACRFVTTPAVSPPCRPPRRPTSGWRHAPAGSPLFCRAPPRTDPCPGRTASPFPACR